MSTMFLLISECEGPNVPVVHLGVDLGVNVKVASIQISSLRIGLGASKISEGAPVARLKTLTPAAYEVSRMNARRLAKK